MDCLFCRIAAHEIPASIVYENEQLLAFKDINPQAPHHLLIIPREHIATINDIHPKHSELLGHMVQTAKQLASECGIATPGYRLLFNVNADGGQAVYHIHLHLLGGRPLAWPPG